MTDDDRRAPEAPEAADAPEAPEAPARPAPAERAPAERPAARDYSVEVSPRQLAGGFAIVAALLVLFVRSRRRRGGKDEAD
jgi:hypothetical protein